MLGNRKGFTLIELLIVVLIIGILATIAVPRFTQMREQTYVAVMQTDLRNLTLRQESYFLNAYEYTADPAELEFVTSDGVEIAITVEAAPARWHATATHLATDWVCDMYYGYDAAPTSYAEEEGVPTCGEP
jgi:prepilin-type N-terminal cleavage/methylation domain-containing protein